MLVCGDEIDLLVPRSVNDAERKARDEYSRNPPASGAPASGDCEDAVGCLFHRGQESKPEPAKIWGLRGYEATSTNHDMKTTSRRSLLAATLGALAWSACSAVHQRAAPGLEASSYDRCEDPCRYGSTGRRAMTDRKKLRATGRTEVKTYVPTPFDEVADGPSLVEVQLTETFRGDIEGESTVRVIQAARKDGSMTFVGLQRVRGSVGGRTGSFLLQPSGTVVGKETKADDRSQF